MTSLVNLLPDHVMQFVPRDDHGKDLLTLRRNILKNIIGSEINFGFALLKHGEVIAILGASQLTTCSVELWAIPSAIAGAHHHLYSRAVKHHCEKFMQVHQAHRFIIAISEKNPEWIKWAEFLGFEMECFAKGYNQDGTGSFLLSKVIEKWQREQ